MEKSIRHILFISFFTLCLALMGTTTSAASSDYSAISLAKKRKPHDEPTNHVIDKCTELAIKVDWLGRYQDRTACIQNLDGAPIYFGCHYIDTDRVDEAKKILEDSMIKVSYASEIGCYGQDEMEKVVDYLEQIIGSLN